jgi:hypothetical protein
MTTLRYHLKLLNYEYLLVMGVVWALGAFLTWFAYHSFNQDAMTIAVLELVFPVPVAVLASAIFASDPARELVCAAERPVWQVVLSRLGIILGLLLLMALLFDGYLAALGITLPGQGNWLERQLVWLSPALVLGLAALLASLWSRSATIGASVAVGVWLLEILLHQLLTKEVLLYGFWLSASQRLFLFATFWETTASFWLENRALLLGVGAVLALVCFWRLSRSEWLVGGE